MNWATDFNRNTEPEITENRTVFPQFVQCSELQIVLTATQGDPGVLALSSSYINLPSVNLFLSRTKPVI